MPSLLTPLCSHKQGPETLCLLDIYYHALCSPGWRGGMVSTLRGTITVDNMLNGEQPGLARNRLYF